LIAGATPGTLAAPVPRSLSAASPAAAPRARSRPAAPEPAILALQRSAGNRATRAAIARSPRQLQRLMGMEVESRVGITHAGKREVSEYPKLGEHPLYRLDADKSKGRTILELVMGAFDEHKGTLEEAKAELLKRLKLMDALVDEAAAAPAGTPLATVAATHGVKLAGGFEDLELNVVPDDPAERKHGPVHFTIGFAPRVMRALLTDQLTKADPVMRKGQANARRAGRVYDDVLALAGQAAEVDAARVAGFMSLLYLQVSALMDAVHAKDEDDGLKKNRTVALSRVSMRTIYDDLPPPERDWLAVNKDALVEVLRSRYSGKAGVWRDVEDDEPAPKGRETKDAKKERLRRNKDRARAREHAEELVPAAARAQIQGAFGVAADDPSKAFGKMTVVPAAEWVGQPQQLGYALELRKFEGLNTGDRARRDRLALQLLEYSRRIHGTDKDPPKQPEATATVDDAAAKVLESVQ
jgi:hypothetical protein